MTPRPPRIVAGENANSSGHIVGGTPTTALRLAQPVDSPHAERIRELLAPQSWSWLTAVVRDTWEQDLSRRRIGVDLTTLSEAQANAMADFFGWPTHRTGEAIIDLAALDTRLRRSGLRAGLVTCLVTTGGPLSDAAGERRALAMARRAEADQLWADTAEHAAFRTNPQLLDWLAFERRAGRLPADPQLRRAALYRAAEILAHLPHPGTGIAQLASRVLGHAHALDSGPAVAAVLRALAWLSGLRDVPNGAEERRQLWSDFGVALDTVSSTVLTLGLRLASTSRLATTVTVNSEAGLPARLTLGQVQHHLRGLVAGPPIVWVCENPSVIEAAADRLGSRCAPLISTEGRPSVAANLLLRALHRAGSQLRYHGDFDWAGLSIAESMIAAGAKPWQMTAHDYLRAVTRARTPLPKLATAPGRAIAASASPWDVELAAVMHQHNLQIEEEHVTDELLADLETAIVEKPGLGQEVADPTRSNDSRRVHARSDD